MSVEFVDTNVLIYAHDISAGSKRETAAELLARLTISDTGALSIQVLAEFYAAATRKLSLASLKAEQIIADFGVWIIHRPAHADLLQAARLQRRYEISWWDALLVNSANELGCAVLWTEDLGHEQKYGSVIARNPFR